MPNWFNFYFNSSPYCYKEFPKSASFKDLQGIEKDILKKGKVKVLSFWSTRCGACINEFPDFQEFYDEYKNDSSVIIYSINMNTPKDPVNADEFIGKKGYSFPCLYMPSDSDRIKFGIRLIPALIVVDQENKIRYFGTFHNKWYDLVHNINGVIKTVKNNSI